MVSMLVLVYSGRPKLGHTIKKNFIKLHCWFRDILNFDFNKKGLGLAYPTCFLYDFLRKIFLILYFIKWPNFIAWLPLCLEILGNMCIVIIICSVWDVINFKIVHGLFIKSFFYICKISGQKSKYLKNEGNFNMK